MTDIDKARQLFRDAGLAFPTIPEELATELKELGPWLFSTRPINLSPYNLQHYVEEVEESQVGDYAVISHSGHGANSYAIQYYLVRGSLHLFLHLGWSGVYSDARKDAAMIRDCFSIADRVVRAAESMSRFQADERLTVVGSDFYGSYWLASGEGRRGEDEGRKGLLAVLTQALDWLTTLSARETVTGGIDGDLPKGLSSSKRIRLNGRYNMELNDLFREKGIDPQQVLVLRHRPSEPKFNKVLGRLAAEKPDVFNAYQQTQTRKVEKAMIGAAYLASFIGQEPGKALFVGLYSIGASKALTLEQYWDVPACIEMKTKYGMRGFTEEDGRSTILWFELVLTDFCASWKGKLIVGWPPPELSWWRRAHRNTMPILAVLEDSKLDPAMKDWKSIVLEWEELGDLSPRWKNALSQWRAIYYIFDTSDRKGYVGSAYGESNSDHPDGNLLGRWLGYAATGHGGNALLRKRNPHNFQFSILERVSPDMSATEVIQLEETWKDRLHTRAPQGLNDN